MKKFTVVHPVISRIEPIGIDSYLAYETIEFGFIPFSFTYPVTVDEEPIRKQIILRATVMRITAIEMVFRLKVKNDVTIVEEIIRITSPLPIESIMENIFRKQHKQLFLNIELQP